MDYQEKYLKYKTKYLKLKNKNKKMLGGSNNEKDNTLYLFKANWCHHCNSFKSTWSDLQNKIGNKINFVTYDADEDSKILKEYKIDGFPTLILKSKGKAIEYVGPRDFNSIKEFIDVYN